MKSKFQNEIRQVLDDIRGKTSEMNSGNIPIPPDVMCRFLIAGEDHRFWYHPAVDPIAIGRSICKNLFSGANQGGSMSRRLGRMSSRSTERTNRSGRGSRRFCRGTNRLA